MRFVVHDEAGVDRDLGAVGRGHLVGVGVPAEPAPPRTASPRGPGQHVGGGEPADPAADDSDPAAAHQTAACQPGLPRGPARAASFRYAHLVQSLRSARGLRIGEVRHMGPPSTSVTYPSAVTISNFSSLKATAVPGESAVNRANLPLAHDRVVISRSAVGGVAAVAPAPHEGEGRAGGRPADGSRERRFGRDGGAAAAPAAAAGEPAHHRRRAARHRACAPR